MWHEFSLVWSSESRWLTRVHLFTLKSSLVAWNYCPREWWNVIQWVTAWCIWLNASTRRLPVHLCIHPVASISREITYRCQRVTHTGSHTCPRDPTLGLTDKLACFSVGLHHGEHCWLAVRQVFLHYLNVLCSLVKWHFLNLLCTLQFFYLCLVVFLSLINTTSLILSWLPFYSSDDSKSKGQLLINSEPCASSFAN